MDGAVEYGIPKYDESQDNRFVFFGFIQTYRSREGKWPVSPMDCIVKKRVHSFLKGWQITCDSDSDVVVVHGRR